MREGIEGSSLYRQIFDKYNTEKDKSDMSIVCYAYMDQVKNYYRNNTKVLPICNDLKDLSYTFFKSKW